MQPNCREQPNPIWPGGGQYDGEDGSRGIEPMGFSSSLMAYVGTIGSIGSTFGIWIFKRCKIVILSRFVCCPSR